MKKVGLFLLLALSVSGVQAGNSGSSFAGGMFGGMMGGLISGAMTKDSGRSYDTVSGLQEAVRYDLLRLRDRIDDIEKRLNDRIRDLESRIRDLERK